MKTKFKQITRKRHLEITLQSFPPHPKPKIHLEQYSTPPSIAADVLWNAYNLNDIEGKNILDLGCGTGIFAIGAVFLGAYRAWGVDVDSDALITAKKSARKRGVENWVNFIESDIKDISMENIFQKNTYSENKDYIDTIIQNPPFGSQLKVKKGSDRIFMEKSVEMAPITYSFHMAETEDFVENYFLNLGAEITHRFYYLFPLPKIYSFHKLDAKEIKVLVVRVKRINK
ncbi:MAG: METTL5 family protein [Methanobacteriaceae archaeon]|nr:METTL5 family protein [Methanobacteriaceae archaeon]